MAGALGLVATGGHFHSAPVPNIKVTGTIPSPLSNGILTTTASFTASGGTAPYQFGTTGNLPPGMNIAGNSGIVAGIPTTLGSYTFSVIAIDANGYIGSTSFTIVVAPYLSDTYYLYTTLLINGETNSGTNYITDASTNNFAVTPYGAANPNRFSPLWGNGYYGNYFDGSTGYLTMPYNSTFDWQTSPTTIEAWLYPTVFSGYKTIMAKATTSSTNDWELMLNSTGNILFRYWTGTSQVLISTNPLVLNTWSHIAFVYDGSTIKLYINGVVNGSAASVSTAAATSGTPLQIGASYGGIEGANLVYFTGYISNARVVKGTAVYTSNFTPSTTPLTAIANTALLTCQSANFVDNSTNAFTLTPNGAVKVVPNQPFGALPSSVQNYGSSLFDGSSSYLALGGQSAFAFGTGNFTIEFWMYTTTASSTQEIYSSQTNGSYTTAPDIYIQSSKFYVQVSSSNPINGSGPTTIISNTWYHVALVKNGSTTTLYVNGVYEASFSDSNTYVIGANRPVIGGYGYNISQYPFSGYISNMRVVKGTAVYTSNFIPPTAPLTAIANTALLTLQNKNGINNNVFYDDSVNNFPITRTGTPTQGTFTPFSQTGWSNYFDQATGGFLSTPNNPTQLQLGSNNFTVECWLNISTLPTGALAVVFSVEGSGLDGVIIGINGTNTPILHPFMYLSTTGGSYTSPANPAIFTTALSLNTWYHIAYVRNGNVFSCFINGVQDATTFTLTGALSYNSGCNATVGARAANSGNYFPGYLSNVRVLNGTALYTSNFTPPTAPLTAIANTALLTCQSNRFVDNSVNNFTLTQPNGGIQVQAFSPFAPGVSYSSANNGGSMYFNGSTDYLNTASVSPLQFGTNSFTIELWIYPLAGSLTADLFDFRTSAVNGLYPTLLLNAGVLNYYTNSATQITGGAPTPYTWSHVALVRNNTSTILYLNGVQTGSTYADSNSYLDGTSAPVIGVSGFSRGSSYFNGYISNLRIVNGTAVYTSAFTPPTAPLTPIKNTSLLLLGTNTGVQDATGKNDIITYGSAMTQSNTVKYGTGALYFNGAGNYLLNPAPANPLLCSFNGSFTIEMWVYLISTGNQYPIFSGYGSSNSQGGIQMSISSGLATGSIYVSSTAYNATNSTSIAQTTWTHLALVRNGTTLTLYVNGVGGTGVSASGATNYSSSFNLYVGQNFSTSYPFTGYIDDLRITNGVARYTANFTPPAVPDLTQ
jgi:hypothetical protein